MGLVRGPSSRSVRTSVDGMSEAAKRLTDLIDAVDEALEESEDDEDE